jgi:hypothetical protein
MSCDQYASNHPGAGGIQSQQHNRNSNPCTSSRGGGRASHTPRNPPELTHYDLQFLSPGFIGQTNPAAFSGYGNPNLYYVGGYPQYSGSMGPPPMDRSQPIGWGNMAPPMCPPHPEPRHRGDDMMEIDEVYQPPQAPS